MMLGSVYSLEGEGAYALKELLGEMGGGMQVALYTTLTGLGSAILLSIQCHWLDRCADRLVSRIIELSATRQRQSGKNG
jgi:biopolymer transport protein ExbB/TolQ